MAFCNHCGTQVADNVAFCGKCGQPIGAASAPANPAVSAVTGMDQNVAGLLSYTLGWVTGIIFLLIDKRPFVRFHAAQSIIVFGGLQVISIILGRVFETGYWYGGYGLFGGYGGFGLGWLLFSGLELVGFVLWIMLMVKAYQNEKFKVPVAGDLAASFAGKSN